MRIDSNRFNPLTFQVFLDPFKILRWLAAASMAFGPAAWLAYVHYKKHFYLDNNRNLLVLFSLVSLAFGLLAGGDTTRIIFLGYPFIMTFAIGEIQNSGLKVNWVFVASLPLMMLPFTIPDPAFHFEAWQQWYPEFANEWLVLIVLFYSVIAAAVIQRLSQKIT